MCNLHPSNSLAYYCRDEHEALCSDCFIKSHKTHDVVSMEEAVSFWFVCSCACVQCCTWLSSGWGAQSRLAETCKRCPINTWSHKDKETGLNPLLYTTSIIAWHRSLCGVFAEAVLSVTRGTKTFLYHCSVHDGTDERTLRIIAEKVT